MKVETKKAKLEFEPIEITIKFESMQEVMNIMHLLQCNAPGGKVIAEAKANAVGKSFGYSVNEGELANQMGQIYGSFFPLIRQHQI